MKNVLTITLVAAILAVALTQPTMAQTRSALDGPAPFGTIVQQCYRSQAANGALYLNEWRYRWVSERVGNRWVNTQAGWEPCPLRPGETERVIRPGQQVNQTASAVTAMNDSRQRKVFNGKPIEDFDANGDYGSGYTVLCDASTGTVVQYLNGRFFRQNNTSCYR